MNMRKLVPAVVLGLFVSAPAFATLDAAKLYKSVFGTDGKPKCTSCHTDKVPKKEDGKHNLNDYGKKLKEAKAPAQEALDEAVLKTVGPNDKAEF